MATSLVSDERVSALNSADPGNGDYVLYWMQAAVRTRHNEALELAVRTANDLGSPLLVAFGIDPDYRDATPRTLRFLAEGVAAAATGLSRRGIPFVVRRGDPFEVASDLAGDASAVVTDRAHLRDPRKWRRQLGRMLDVPVWEVETNLVVPVDVTSDKREYAARTIRPKIHDHLDRFVVDLTTTPLEHKQRTVECTFDATDTDVLMEVLDVAAPPGRFEGGQHQARAVLDRFLASGLRSYRTSSPDPSDADGSQLSPYLHYGHISPVDIVSAVRTAGAAQEQVDSFIEEVVVRRELAHNYVWHEPDYDSFSALPEWARATLKTHESDQRDVVYTAAELEAGKTEDRAWNAAMAEMRETGYLHNHLRMYWGKQILRWTNTPRYAHRVALELNNRYLLDGRDANSYANVAWIFGLHDRAFGEREIFGKVRPMTHSGLERKIDIENYVRYVEDVTGQEIA